ncbi:MAG: hypothetical protein H8D23_20325 [Candidatus Brocadiales bacterium]|nr:hypothetical protein [Candidatus Brocadiales bacterium]
MIKYTKYTEKENKIIIKKYPTVKTSEIAKELNRGVKAINRQASLLGIKKANTWTKSKKEWLKENYATSSKEELVAHLEFTYTQIVNIANKMKLTRNRWTSKEEDLVRELYSEKGPRHLSNLINKSPETIKAKANSLGIKSDVWWTDGEISFLKDNYSLEMNRDIAKKLNRTKSSVAHMARKLGITSIKESQLEKDAEIFLKENKINFVSQEKIWRYRIDFKIDEKILLEMNGTFWHCDPRVYKDGPLYDRQKKRIISDEKKYKALTKAGYKLIIIWEQDFYENPEIVIEAITAVRNGDVTYYDSAKTVKPETAIPC